MIRNAAFLSFQMQVPAEKQSRADSLISCLPMKKMQKVSKEETPDTAELHILVILSTSSYSLQTLAYLKAEQSSFEAVH